MIRCVKILHHHGEIGEDEQNQASLSAALSPGKNGQTPGHTHTSTKEVLHRLSRIAGHLDHVKRMVEDDRDCADVLIQLAAVRSAMNGVCKVILKDHMEHCIVDALASGDKEALDNLNRAIELLMK